MGPTTGKTVPSEWFRYLGRDQNQDHGAGVTPAEVSAAPPGWSGVGATSTASIAMLFFLQKS